MEQIIHELQDMTCLSWAKTRRSSGTARGGRPMRVFAIRDETLSPDVALGYLIYYERAKAFYIELPEDADPWNTPLLLSSFVKRGQYSVSSYWSRLWVQQRIVPPDRQNIGQILKENGLAEYDEFQLLLLTMGRCAQDDCYLEEIDGEQLPDPLPERWKTKVEDVVPLQNARLLVFFRNGEVRIADVRPLAEKDASYRPWLVHEDRFRSVEVQPGGYGVMWSERVTISDRELYEHSEAVPLTLNDFIGFVQNRIVSAGEACQILGCSRQNISDLIKRNKLHPIRRDARYKLFLRNEIIQRKQP